MDEMTVGDGPGVNVLVVQLARPDITEEVAAALAAACLPHAVLDVRPGLTEERRSDISGSESTSAGTPGHIARGLRGP